MITDWRNMIICHRWMVDATSVWLPILARLFIVRFLTSNVVKFYACENNYFNGPDLYKR